LLQPLLRAEETSAAPTWCGNRTVLTVPCMGCFLSHVLLGRTVVFGLCTKKPLKNFL